MQVCFWQQSYRFVPVGTLRRSYMNLQELIYIRSENANSLRGNIDISYRFVNLTILLDIVAFDSRAISNPKRSRTVFQPHQLRRLQYEFDREMYMVGMKRRNLSKELDLSEKQIKIWFQNRRMKQKREHNRKRNRSFENLQKVCADPNRYFDEFGGLEALDISDSRNANNPRMLMLWTILRKDGR